MFFLNIKQLAERYGIAVSTAKNFVRKGTLPKGVKIGACHRWPVQELENFEKNLT